MTNFLTQLKRTFKEHVTTLVVTFLEQTTLSVIPFPTPLQYVFPLVQKTVREIYLFPDSATPVTEE